MTKGYKFFFTFLSISWHLLHAQDTLTSIAVYKIKSEVLPESFSNALTEHIESKLLSFPFYRVISRSNLDILITEDQLIQSGVMYDGKSDKNKGGLSSIDKICTGLISKIGKSYSFTLKIIDTHTGEIDAAAQKIHTGSEEGLLDICNELLEQICHRPKIIKRSDTLKIPSSPKPIDTSNSSKSVIQPIKHKSFTIKQKEDLSKASSPVIKRAIVSSQQMQKTTVPINIENKIDNHKPTKLGKQISIGAAVVFGTVATLLIIAKTQSE